MRQLYSHQAEAYQRVAAGEHIVVTTPTASGKTLCYNLPVLDAILKDGATRALYLFPTKALAQDQMAELHELAALISDGGGERHRRAHLRRRHAGRRAPDDPRAGAHRAHQSRHAARRHPAAPPALGEAVREPALRGDRRAARLSRRLRQPPVQRAAPAAAHLPALRLGPAVHLLVGDHRQPARAGRTAGRAALLARRRERRAARREVHRVRQPAGGQPRARHPPLVPGRGAAGGGRVPAPQPAGDRVRAEPAGHRDPHHLPQGGLRDRAGHGRADSRLPRRLPAAAPARDREGPARGPGARRRLDQRAGARHRHRRARRVGDGRLSRHHRLHVAAGRPRRPPHRAVGGGDGGQLGAGRSVRGQAPDRTSSTPRPSTRWSIPTTCTSWSIT